MLTITITPSALIFTNVSECHYDLLKSKYHAETTLKGTLKINGDESKLYKILMELSYDYDIEIM